MLQRKNQIKQDSRSAGWRKGRGVVLLAYTLMLWAITGSNLIATCGDTRGRVSQAGERARAKVLRKVSERDLAYLRNRCVSRVR